MAMGFSSVAHGWGMTFYLICVKQADGMLFGHDKSSTLARWDVAGYPQHLPAWMVQSQGRQHSI